MGNRPGHMLAVIIGAFLMAFSAHAESHVKTDTDATGLRGELIDYVWSGHPVSYAILADRGYLYIAYYDGDRRLTVLSRKIGDVAWTRFLPEGVLLPRRKRMSNVTGWDSHNR